MYNVYYNVKYTQRIDRTLSYSHLSYMNKFAMQLFFVYIFNCNLYGKKVVPTKVSIKIFPAINYTGIINFLPSICPYVSHLQNEWVLQGLLTTSITNFKSVGLCLCLYFFRRELTLRIYR